MTTADHRRRHFSSQLVLFDEWRSKEEENLLNNLMCLNCQHRRHKGCENKIKNKKINLTTTELRRKIKLQSYKIRQARRIVIRMRVPDHKQREHDTGSILA